MRRIFLSLDGRLRSGWRAAALLASAGVLKLLLGATVGIVVAVVVIATGRNLDLGFLKSFNVQMVLVTVEFPLLMGLIWIFRRFLDRRTYRSLGFWMDRLTVRDMGLGLAMGAALVLLMTGTLFAAGWCCWSGVQSGNSPGVGGLLLAILGFATAAMAEEVLCRGYMQSNLAESVGPVPAIAITSLIFAAFHVGNPNLNGLALANLILAGLLFGVAYQRFRTLWAPWAMHFAWNFTMSTVLGVPVSGMATPSLSRVELAGPEWWTGGAFGFEGGLAATAAVVLFTAGLLVWRGRPARPAEPVGRRADGPPPSGELPAVPPAPAGSF